MVDDVRGGFYGRRDAYHRLHPDANKGVILTTRILWTFASAGRFFQQDPYAKMAERALQYLYAHFWDETYGGVYWMVSADGAPVERKKQVYAQAFAIYGLSEFHRMTGNQQSLTRAQELFQLVETHSRDREQGGYLEAFAEDWGIVEDVRLSVKDLHAAKTMNTHLHVLEAYTNLFRVWPDDILGQALRELIELFLSRFIDQETGNLHLFFTEDWTGLSHDISFGHDIEASWLLCEAAEMLHDPDLSQKVSVIALKMVDITLEKGVDHSDGGLWNEAGPNDHWDRDKHWWPQAEAMVGCLQAWRTSKDERYLDACGAFWAFIQAHLIDKVYGEWHWGIQPNGQIMNREDKAGPWKAPYHHVRALMEGIERLSG